MKTIWWLSKQLVLLALCTMCFSQEQQNATNNLKEIGNINITVPKCCEIGEHFTIRNGCIPEDSNEDYQHFYFESNESHINNERIPFIPRFYKKFIECGSGFSRVQLFSSDIVGFIYNSSIIFDTELISDDKYCVNSVQDGFLACLKSESDPTQAGSLSFHLPCLVISTLCYFCSAFIYHFILKVKEVHKKCVVGFSLSMGVTFLFWIILQIVYVQGTCSVIGGFFFVSILSSFVWLTCLCIDLGLAIRNFQRDNDSNRILMYTSASLAIPCIILGLSLLIQGTPDVPKSFIKSTGSMMCSFKSSNNYLIFFVPVGLLLLCSLCILVCDRYLIFMNNRKYRNDVNWLERRSISKYMLRSCFLIWFTTAIWIIYSGVMISNSIGNRLPLDVIEAIQGIFLVVIFVSNRYTRKEIRAAMCNKTSSNDNSNRIISLRKRFANFSLLRNNNSNGNREADTN